MGALIADESGIIAPAPPNVIRSNDTVHLHFSLYRQFLWLRTQGFCGHPATKFKSCPSSVPVPVGAEVIEQCQQFGEEVAD
jgi:hypothetical protein